MNVANISISRPDKGVIYSAQHTAPASWTEMTGTHLLLWASVMGSKLTRSRAEQQLAAFLYNIPVKLFRYIRPAHLVVLIESLDFLLKKNMLSKWPIKSISLGWRRYYGPKDALANITIEEFSLCEHCYTRFQITREVAYLETLVAILYRPHRMWGIDNDVRRPLTTAGYVKRAVKFKKLAAGLKYAVYLNYEGCRNYIHAKYPDVFTKGASGSKVKSAPPQWPKIIESASNDIFGTFNQTNQTNLHRFLSRLSTRMKEMRELEKENKK